MMNYRTRQGLVLALAAVSCFSAGATAAETTPSNRILSQQAAQDVVHLVVERVDERIAMSEVIGRKQVSDAGRWEVIRVPASEKEALTSLLLAHENVRSVEVDPVVSVPKPEPISAMGFIYGDWAGSDDYNDPGYFRQYHFAKPSDYTGGSSITEALSAAETNEPATVVVIDTQFDSTHPDFTWQGGQSFHTGDDLPWDGYDEDTCDEYHGQAVASVMGAHRNSGMSITGIVDDAHYYGARALGCNNSGLLSASTNAINWAVGETPNGVDPIAETADIINLSLSGTTSCPSSMQDAIDRARNRGALVVAAAGNANDDVANYAPANCNGVFTVAATDKDGYKASFTNAGSAVDISAMGVQVPTQKPNDPYSYLIYSGTSFSSPAAAGMLGLLWQHLPSLTNDELAAIALDSATDLRVNESGMGQGILNALLMFENAVDHMFWDPDEVQVAHPLADRCINASAAEFYAGSGSVCDLREIGFSEDRDYPDYYRIVMAVPDGQDLIVENGEIMSSKKEQELLISDWDESKGHGIAVCQSDQATDCIQDELIPIDLASVSTPSPYCDSE